MKNILLPFLIFLVSCSPSEEERNTTALAKKIKVDDLYSLDRSGHPMRNGEYYAFDSGYLVGEIWNISIAKGYGVKGANSSCYKAMTLRAANGKDDYQICDQLLENLSRNQTILSQMRNDKKYK